MKLALRLVGPWLLGIAVGILIWLRGWEQGYNDAVEVRRLTEPYRRPRD